MRSSTSVTCSSVGLKPSAWKQGEPGAVHDAVRLKQRAAWAQACESLRPTCRMLGIAARSMPIPSFGSNTSNTSRHLPTQYRSRASRSCGRDERGTFCLCSSLCLLTNRLLPLRASFVVAVAARQEERAQRQAPAWGPVEDEACRTAPRGKRRRFRAPPKSPACSSSPPSLHHVPSGVTLVECLP